MKNRSISFRSVCALTWRVPLAILSLLFFRTTRCVLRGLVNRHYRIHAQEARRWRIFSAENLTKPAALPYVMTNAPRLNLHAVAAAVGPLAVTQSLSVDVSAAFRSARSWSIVIYEVAGTRTVASISPVNSPSETSWHTLSLPPGAYAILLRYYHWSDSVSFPAVRIDGRDAVEALAAAPDITDFYRDLFRRGNRLYVCLHYHIHILLRYRAWLPASFVESAYLPVGNPDTRFHYGLLEGGERLTIAVDPALLESYDVFLTLYDRAGFPVEWSQLRDARTTALCRAGPCSYLIRVHPIRTEPTGGDPDALMVDIE